MRAMILAAGRGTRMGALSHLLAKPALPVRGVPVIGHLLHWLARHEIREVIVNLHHRPETVAAAARAWRPKDLTLQFSREEELLGTGGGVALAAEFLRGDGRAPALILSGDMLIDFDLSAALERHRDDANQASLVLANDPRTESFGSIGIDDDGRIRRIGTSFDWGGETKRGVFLGVRIFSPQAIDWHRQRSGAFEDLRDVLAPRIPDASSAIRAIHLDEGAYAWLPVGNIREYLAANFETVTDASGAPRWRELDAEATARGTRLGERWIGGTGAVIEGGCELERVVVWEHERVASGTKASDGVVAGGRFHPASEASVTARADAEERGPRPGKLGSES